VCVSWGRTNRLLWVKLLVVRRGVEVETRKKGESPETKRQEGEGWEGQTLLPAQAPVTVKG